MILNIPNVCCFNTNEFLFAFPPQYDFFNKVWKINIYLKGRSDSSNFYICNPNKDYLQKVYERILYYLDCVTLSLEENNDNCF